jgi:hypothetical protein
MKRRTALACLVLLASVSLCLGQKSKDKSPPTVDEENERLRQSYEWTVPGPFGESVPPALLRALTRVELPEGKDAWVVQVVTSGGFTGRGRGDVTLTSAGVVTCSPAVVVPCADKLSPASLESLSKLIASANPKKWQDRPGGACSDCYGTLLVLQRRDAKGRCESYKVYFDDTTLALMPEEVRQIYARAFDLAAPPK